MSVYSLCQLSLPQQGADAFETIYQQFAIVWNKPWLLLCYEVMLLLIKLIFVPIWALFCIAGFSIVMLPMRLLHTETLQQFMGYANLWLGGAVEKLATLPYINYFGVFDIGTNTQMPTLVGNSDSYNASDRNSSDDYAAHGCGTGYCVSVFNRFRW